MRIGIITHYYKSLNYGGVLQAYALCRYLSEQGYEAQQICYDRSKDPPFWGCRLFKIMGRPLLKVIRKKQKQKSVSDEQRERFQKREEAISQFRQNFIPHTKQVYTAKDIQKSNRQFDIFIVGSDQVWHPYAVCDAYLLDFVESRTPKIAYAASFAVDRLDHRQARRYQKSLSSFSAISVREKSAIGLLERMNILNAQVVLDPTLLLTKTEWDQICDPRCVSQNYLFCYFLGSSIEQRKAAVKYAQKNGLAIVTLPNLGGEFVRECDEVFGDIQLYAVAPQQFVSLIKYADAVITDSFHASVFSIIYQKDFLVFPRDDLTEISSRISDLLQVFSMSDRFLKVSEEITEKNVEDVLSKKVSKILTDAYVNAKKKSIDFLKGQINKGNLL